jgi:hypothetical protein
VGQTGPSKVDSPSGAAVPHSRPRSLISVHVATPYTLSSLKRAQSGLGCSDLFFHTVEIHMEIPYSGIEVLMQTQVHIF